MALEWLKNILGSAYTEDIDKSVTEELGKTYVAKEDFDKLSEEKAALATQPSKTADTEPDTGNAVAQEKPAQVATQPDTENFKDAAEEWQRKYEEALKQADDVKFNSNVDMAILQAKGRNAGAIKGALGSRLDELRTSENLSDALKGLLDEFAKENDYLFDCGQIQQPYSAAAGSADLKKESAPFSIEDALKDRIYGKKG